MHCVNDLTMNMRQLGTLNPITKSFNCRLRPFDRYL